MVTVFFCCGALGRKIRIQLPSKNFGHTSCPRQDDSVAPNLHVARHNAAPCPHFVDPLSCLGIVEGDKRQALEIRWIWVNPARHSKRLRQSNIHGWQRPIEDSPCPDSDLEDGLGAQPNSLRVDQIIEPHLSEEIGEEA